MTLTLDILNPTQGLPDRLRELAERAGVSFEVSSGSMKVKIQGDELECRYLTRCLLRAGFDFEIL